MNAAPLSERSNLKVSYHVLGEMSTPLPRKMPKKSRRFVQIIEENAKTVAHCGENVV